MSKSVTRIPVLIRLLERAWYLNHNLRLGQLLQLAAGPKDPYYVEDSQLELRLRDVINAAKKEIA